MRVGPTCIDRYEASVWKIPADAAALVRKVRFGRASADTLLAGGATQVAPAGDTCRGDEYGAGFPPNGNWTEPLYAVSVAGVKPNNCITWFQAQQACLLSGKRLLRNDEWQAAATGTPDPNQDDDHVSTCNTASDAVTPSGSRPTCRSSWGIYDAVGNLWEWTADWFDQGFDCDFWPQEYGGDISCSGKNVSMQGTAATAGAGAPTIGPHFPAAITRGGDYTRGASSGIFAFYAGYWPGTQSVSTGFRCGR